MMLRSLTTRLMSVLAMGAISLASLAPAAHAGHGPWGGPKFRRHVEFSHEPRYYPGGTRVEVHSRYHEGGGAFAGFVGGLLLGAAVSHASEPAHLRYAPPPPCDYYYDPYCDVRFNSLDACTRHFCHADHPREVECIATDSQRVLDRYYFDRGHWHVYDDGRDGYRDRGGDRYDDRNSDDRDDGRDGDDN